MKKVVLTMLTALFAATLLSGCCLKHDWQEATCKEPMTCAKCGKTEGEKLSHEWKEATCAAPKTCELCGKTKGDALPHTFKDATCSAPRTCVECGETEGEALPHTFEFVSCDEPMTCTECGAKDGTAPGHDWLKATLTLGNICSVCGLEEGFPLTIEEYMKEDPSHDDLLEQMITEVINQYSHIYKGYLIEYDGNTVHYHYYAQPGMSFSVEGLRGTDWDTALAAEAGGFASLYGVTPARVIVTYYDGEGNAVFSTSELQNSSDKESVDWVFQPTLFLLPDLHKDIKKRSHLTPLYFQNSQDLGVLG